MERIPVRRIHNSVSDKASGNVKVLKINELSDDRGLYQPVHRHDFFFLMVIEKGRGTHQIDFLQYNVEDYSVFFMRPGQVHSLELSAGTEGYIIEFSPSLFYFNDNKNSLFRKIGRRNFYQFDKGSFSKLKSNIQGFYEELNDEYLHHENAMESYLSLILIELSRLDSSSPAQSNPGFYLLERLEELQELLESKISENKKVSEYAKMMSLTSYQLNKITKTALNKTCSDLINEQIVLESKRQLLSTSNQINQVAFTLGYDDVSYFTRFFKKHTGYSPSEFKNKFE